MKARINGYISSIMEESALIKGSRMLFLASFAGSLFLFMANIIYQSNLVLKDSGILLIPAALASVIFSKISKLNGKKDYVRTKNA